MASASSDQLDLMLKFNEKCQEFLSQTEELVHGKDPVSVEEVGKVKDEVTEAKLVKAQTTFPTTTQVKCKVFAKVTEVGGEDDAVTSLQSRWVSGCIVCGHKVEDGHTTYICFIPEDYHRKTINRTQGFRHEDVRLTPGQTLKVASPDARLPGASRTMKEFMDVRHDAIKNGYCPKTWPFGILLWQLRQCTEIAEDLNRQLYQSVCQTVVDTILRNKLQKGVDGDLVGFLLNCRRGCH